MPNVTRAAQEAIVSRQRCRRPHCSRIATCRGLCQSDYQTAYQLVTAGVTTWEELERHGKADEPRRSAKSWFLNKAS